MDSDKHEPQTDPSTVDDKRQSIRRKPVATVAAADTPIQHPTQTQVQQPLSTVPEPLSEKQIEARVAEDHGLRQQPHILQGDKEKILPIAPTYTTSTFDSTLDPDGQTQPTPPPVPPKTTPSSGAGFLSFLRVGNGNTHHRSQPSLLLRLKHKYRLLSRRKRIAVISIPILILLIFIIGLSAGLATRKNGSSGRVTNLPLPSNHGGPYTGDLTYYAPALGSCGITSTSEDAIVAVSHLIYDAVSTSSNPNLNPLCGKKIRARRNGKSIDVTVVDRCVGCKAEDLDVTESVFVGLADLDQGRVPVEWAWLEDVPSGAAI